MSARSLSFCCLLLVGGGPGIRAEEPRNNAGQAVSVFPVAPADQAVSQERPVFFIGYRGLDENQLRDHAFRITITEERASKPTHVFDQRERRNGWFPGQPGHVVFRPPWPLRDGSYRWEVDHWDGVDWSGGGIRHRLRIDTVPPADVEGLTLHYPQDAAQASIRISWKPVTLDQAGTPEFVTRYRIYRYSGNPELPVARPFEIGETEIPEFTDRDPDLESPIVFYRVIAEDLAGNLTGLRQ